MKQAATSFSITVLVLISSYLILQNPHSSPAQSNNSGSNACCGPAQTLLPRELDFPYYSLQNGFGSTLNLVSDSPTPLDFTLSVHARSGLTVVAPKMTIQPQAKLPIDMAALLQSLGADATGDFAEGSVSLNFVGTIMPLVGQMTITNPALGLVHEAEMVENDPGRTDIPPMLQGVWWNISGGRDAQVMVTNMSSLRASADVYLDYAGERHSSAALTFNPHETKTVSVTQMLAALNTTPSQAPEGGITIIQRELQPTLIAQGRVLDPVTGFSTTISFPDPARERANSLHATGVPIGTPTQDSPFANTGYFVPHVVVRNLTGAAQTVTVTVEYPKGTTWNSAEGPGGNSIPAVRFTGILQKGQKNPNDALDHPPNPDPATLSGQLVLAPLTVEPYSTLDYSLDSVFGQLPSAVPYCSIRIQYSGAPGSAIAQVSSVEMKSDMVIDAAVANEGDVWRGSGANPWHLDSQTESIVFLTDASDKPARIGFSVTAGGVQYYLTTLKLAPHETRAIDIRKLRDAQQPDFKKNLIPADATDGSVSWIRLDKVAVSGRLIVMQRRKGIASSYDCCFCPCPSSYQSLQLDPGQFPLYIQQILQMDAQGQYLDCNNNKTWYDLTNSSNWSTSNGYVAGVNTTGNVTGYAGGSATIASAYSDCDYYDPGCDCTMTQNAAQSTVSVDSARISSAVQTIDGSITPSFNVTTAGDTPTSYVWSFTSPSGAGNSPNVNFNPSNQASTTTDAHWFALPNDACNASTSSVYTIFATVNFPGAVQAQDNTTLTVMLFTRAGYENEVFMSGLPSTGQNPQGIWIVTGQGSLSRNVASPVVVYATTSQFYNKVYAHENEHYLQWTTGMNSDLYAVSNLYSQLSPLTSSTQADLQNQINTTIGTWNSNQHSTYVSRLPAAETDAYRVSDPIAPQYFYQSTCPVQGL